MRLIKPRFSSRMEGFSVPFFGFLLGILVFLAIYGVEPLRVTGSGWIFQGVIESDILQHYAGWMFFRDSPWTWPLGLALNMGYPYGANISYTDSIPIVSIFFKAISAWLPEHFQFFGLYTLLSFALQGAAAALLLRLFTKEKVPALLGTAIFLFSSCMIERAFRHTALASHWLILFALFLYIKSVRNHDWRWIGGFGILNLLAIGIHPYLFVMVFVIFCAAFLSLLIDHSEGNCIRKKICFSFLLILLITFASGSAIGLFENDQVKPAGGFGFYSLNLNQIYNPTAKGMEQWSALLPKQPQEEGQEDGLYYLGAGILLFSMILFLRVISLAAFSPHQRAALWQKAKILTSKYFILLITCLLLLLFALSNRITWNQTVIAAYPLPDRVVSMFNIFRSSGRFFTVVYYLWFLTVIIGVFRFFKKRKNIVLFVLLIIQICDMAPALKEKYTYFHQRYEKPYIAEIWTHIAQNYSKVIVIGENRDLQLAGWIGDHHLKTNMMFSAPVHLNRFWEKTKEERDELLERIIRGEELEKDAVYLFDSEAILPEISAGLNSAYEIIRTDNYYHVYYIILPRESG
ncbi:DUF6311 domain-containing protein [Flexilinea flocculi]|nr:DUF6311 domain-containing protein [Flexilinea flocculi]